MKVPKIALALALGLPGAQALAQAQPAVPPAPRTIKVSPQASKAIKALEDAVNAKNFAAVPALLAAAQAAAKTASDRLMIGQLQLKAGVAANDLEAIDAGIAAMAASGEADRAILAKLYLSAADMRIKAKQYDRAAASLERALAIEPANADAISALAEARIAQGRNAEGVALIRKGIAAQAAARGKAEEKLYKRAVAVALKANLPEVFELSRQWVAAYPAVGSWRDAIRIYRQVAKPDGAATLDALRLARAVKALESENEYALYIYEAADNSAAGEAKAVLAEATAAGAIDPKSKLFAELDRPVRMQAAGESVNLAARASAALAAASAGPALAAGDSHFGRGDYAKAAELYRAALAKTGADADRINLHLGMALARQGDKAGAVAALGKVGGARAELAKYWLLYVSLLP